MVDKTAYNLSGISHVQSARRRELSLPISTCSKVHALRWPMVESLPTMQASLQSLRQAIPEAATTSSIKRTCPLISSFVKSVAATSSCNCRIHHCVMSVIRDWERVMPILSALQRQEVAVQRRDRCDLYVVEDEEGHHP